MLKDLNTLLEVYQKECPGLVSFMGAFMSSEQVPFAAPPVRIRLSESLPAVRPLRGRFELHARP